MFSYGRGTPVLLRLCPSFQERLPEYAPTHWIEAYTVRYRWISWPIFCNIMLWASAQQGINFIWAIQNGNLTGVVCFLANLVLAGLFVPCAYRYLPAAKPQKLFRRSHTGQFCNHRRSFCLGEDQILNGIASSVQTYPSQGCLSTRLLHRY